MSAQALITSTRARLPSPARALAVLIIVLSVSGVGLAVFMVTEPRVATRPHIVGPKHLTSTHRTRPRPRH